MARARRRAGFLKLPPPIDLQSVRTLHTRLRVLEEGGHIDASSAHLLRWAMRQFAANLRFLKAQEVDRSEGGRIQT